MRIELDNGVKNPITPRVTSLDVLLSSNDPNKTHLHKGEPCIVVKDKTIIFVEEGANGKAVKYRLDFGTPKTQAAAAKAGIAFKDCLKKPKADFFAETTNEKIAQMGYERHREKVQENIKQLFALRKEIINNEKKREREKDSTSLGKSSSVRSLRQSSITKANPGHFPDPIKEIFAPLSKDKDGIVNAKAMLGHAERKEMMNYVAKAWKELNMIIDDQRRDGVIKAKKKGKGANSSNNDSTSRSPKSPNTGELHPGKSGSAKKGKGANRAGEKTKSIGEGKSSENEEEANENKRGKSSDLSNQILTRIQSRKLTLQKMAVKESMQQKKDQQKEQEWEQKQSKLKNITSKRNFYLHMKIVEKVDSHVAGSNTKKVVAAARSSSNCQSIRDKVDYMKTQHDQKTIESYVKTAEKIEECKKKREGLIQEAIERRKKMLADRKQRQEEYCERQRAESVKTMNQYAKQLEKRDEKTRLLIQKVTTENKQQWKELTKLNGNLQKENTERITKVKEYKRNSIWDNHRTLEEKNKQKNTFSQTQQCAVRTSSIYSRKGKEHTYQFINLMMMADPNKETQREKLIEALQLINNKLGFGLKLRLPSPGSPANKISQ